MQELTLFQFENKQVRTLVIDDEPYFVGKDVAVILGYKNTRDALGKHVDKEDKNTVAIHDGIGNPNKTVINESGLYSLILSSQLTTAKKFKHWVTSEVLPTIRQKGVYNVSLDKNSIAEMLLEAGHQLKEANTTIEQMKPKAMFADAVKASDTSILVGELAKILKQNGINIGQNRLFAWLREKGYLINANRSDHNMPTQKSLELGLFEIKERTFQNPDGSTKITKTPKITGKGQQYFINKFLGQPIIKEQYVLDM